VNEYNVRIFTLYIRKDRPKPYMVRWVVAGRRRGESFITRALADNF
jgi:hypothetical protein